MDHLVVEDLVPGRPYTRLLLDISPERDTDRNILWNSGATTTGRNLGTSHLTIAVPCRLPYVEEPGIPVPGKVKKGRIGIICIGYCHDAV